MDDSGPAFPRPDTSRAQGHRGMTYRKWLIGRVMTGAILEESFVDKEKMAREAVKLADAIISYLAKEE